MTKVTLLPCPFCGGEARHDHPSRSPRVYCSRCRCSQACPEIWNFRGEWLVWPGDCGPSGAAATAERDARIAELEAVLRDAQRVLEWNTRAAPEGQTPLDDNLRHRYLDVIREGEAAFDGGKPSPYHGHSLEHCLHAVGWVKRDLRVALNKSNQKIAAQSEAIAERDALLHDALSLLEVNARTKSRDDHAEQKLIVRIRQALAGGRDDRD